MSEKVYSIDEEIINLYKIGDREKALKLFVDEYQTRLYSLSYQMLGNHDDAMDTLQEILIQINRSLASFEGKSTLYTWVYRLSSNVCLNFRKKKSRTNHQVQWDENLLQTVMLPVERPNEDPDKMCETKYKQFLVQQGILKLPVSQRMVVVLHDIEGMSIPESAGILNITVNVAKSRLHRGRAALRKIITKGFEVKGMEGVGVCAVDPTGQLM